MMYGEIDSGIWAVSYLLSMYQCCPGNFILSMPPKIEVNDVGISIDDLSPYTCYMDCSYPLFSSNRPINKMVEDGLHKCNLNYGAEEIRDLFHISRDRFKREFAGVGNEVFKCMAAVAYCHGKQIFCFPWFSQMRYMSYHGHMPDLLNILERLNQTVIIPLSQTAYEI